MQQRSVEIQTCKASNFGLKFCCVFLSKIGNPSISYKKESYIFRLTAEIGIQAMAMEPPKKGMQNGPYRASKHNDCFPTIEG